MVRQNSLGVTGTRKHNRGAEIRSHLNFLSPSLAAGSMVLLCIPDLDQFISAVRSEVLVAPPSIPTVCCLGFIRLTGCNQVEM